MIETVHNELNKLSDTIKKKVESGEFPNIKYTCILRDGIPEEEILRYAKEYNPQIIIMGTRGRSQKRYRLDWQRYGRSHRKKANPLYMLFQNIHH